MPVERFRAEYGSTELYNEELSGKNSQYNKLHPVRFGKSLECRIGSTEYTGIEQIPELQHDKEGEENSQVVYIHSLRAVVEIINHSEQYDEEDRAHAYYISPHCLTDNKIGTATRFLKHHRFAGWNGGKSQSGKSIHNQVHP